MEKKLISIDEREIESMYKSVFHKLEINDLYCKSSFVEDKKFTWQKCEEYLQKNEYSKIRINNIYFVHTIDEGDDGTKKLVNFDQNHLRVYMQIERQKIFNILLEYVNSIDNKYELIDFFKKLNDRIKRQLSTLNYDSWVKENFTPGGICNVHLFVKGEYMPIPFLSVDLQTSVGYYIEQEFAFRYNLIFTLWKDLHEIFSEHLFLTSNHHLPSTPTKLNRTDISEVIYFLEEHCNIEKFSDFKSIALQMLQISSEEYSKNRNNIVSRKKGKFQFIAEVLKRENYYVELLRGN